MIGMIDRTKRYAFDSRRICPGDVYICLPGGDAYIQHALDNGASDVLHLTRQEFADAANDYFEHITKKCTLIGITGTNGKTSVAYFTAQLLEYLDCSTLMIGTLNASLTTPESWDTLNRIKQHVEAGGTHVVLEVSSHGIDQYRVWGMDFDIKCLTNITQDHLDYHGSIETYRATKMTFMETYPGMAIYSDDVILLDPEDIPNLKGECHRKNISMAVAICCKLGLPLIDILPLLPKILPPQGRFETIQMNQPQHVIVDFAHTPDGLRHVLNDARQLVDGTAGQVHVVFGCGGDRDSDKRPKMGAVAEEFCHRIYLTADNSRKEPTQTIIQDILTGMTNTNNVTVEPDRRIAITLALANATPTDVVVIAGKGHEMAQIGNNYQYWFNDRLIILHALNQQDWGQKYTIDSVSTAVDVMFVSKEFNALNGCQVAPMVRSIPLPQDIKIQSYLKKIQGEIIVVLEQDCRFSLGRLLRYFISIQSKCYFCTFNANESVTHNLAGLYLIEQQPDPVIVIVDPYQHDEIKRILTVLQPDHLIIGDILDENQVIPYAMTRAITQWVKKGDVGVFWCYAEMMDIMDELLEKDTISDHLNTIHASNWMEYNQFLLEDMLLQVNLSVESVKAMFVDYLLASNWVQKVTINNVSVVILNWDNDAFSAKMKLAFFEWDQSELCHVITMDNHAESLVSVLAIQKSIDPSQLFMIQPSLLSDACSGHVQQVDTISAVFHACPNKHYVMWKSSDESLDEWMKKWV